MTIILMAVGLFVGNKIGDLLVEQAEHSWHMRQDRLLLKELRDR